jgi:hypothetical protein
VFVCRSLAVEPAMRHWKPAKTTGIAGDRVPARLNTVLAFCRKWDRGFESGLLQRRVMKPGLARGLRRSVSQNRSAVPRCSGGSPAGLSAQLPRAEPISQVRRASLSGRSWPANGRLQCIGDYQEDNLGGLGKHQISQAHSGPRPRLNRMSLSCPQLRLFPELLSSVYW